MSLDQAFFALGDPTRRAILAQLAQGEATVADLAKPHRLSQPAISKHLKVLEEAGLVDVRVDGPSRPRRLCTDGLKPVHDWLAVLQRQWEQRLDRLDAFIDNTRKE